MNRTTHSIYAELEEMRWKYKELDQFGEPHDPIGCWGMDDWVDQDPRIAKACDEYRVKKEAWRKEVRDLRIAIAKLECEYEDAYYEEEAYYLVRLTFGDE